MVVIIDKEAHEASSDDAMSVQSALKEAARGGRIGNLKVDAESLILKDPGKFSIFLKLKKLAYRLGSFLFTEILDL